MIVTSQQRRSVLICLWLALATAVVYWPVRHFEFVNYDDYEYVTGNPHLRSGLTLNGFVWAVTTPLDHWMPVTWLARLIECQLFGLDAAAHHLVNVLFHIANAVLLYGILNRMTGALWRSALVATLFALHPLHVESVAWVTEFKNVLSTCFWMLTVWTYTRYVERSTVPRYTLTLILYALGLMAKPMLVTLPCVLLLLDFWPLGRTRWGQPAVGKRTPTEIRRLIWEKLPFIVLSVALSAITYWARATGAFASDVKSLPLALRVSNAAVSYVRYVAKVFWPVDLAVFYPHPGTWKLWGVVSSAAAVCCLTVVVIRCARTKPYLTVGWLWYLGTLVPAIGLIQAGDQSIADRFTYIPSIGLFIMIAWGLPELVSRWRRAELAVNVIVIGVILGLMAATRHQLQFWANSISLFERAIAVTRDNYIAQNNLGVAFRERGALEPAALHFHEAIRIWPEYPEANKNLADILVQSGQSDEAIRHYRQTLQKRPDWAEAHNNLGLALAGQAKWGEAIEHFERAVGLDPQGGIAHSNLALALLKIGRLDDALAHASRALNLDPEDEQAHYLMGLVLQKQGRLAEAGEQFAEAIRLRPGYAEALKELSKLRQ